MVAFRCRNCGHFETAAQAGDNPVPAACSICDKGVWYHWDGSSLAHWVADPANWEVLADASPERLAELGLTDVERHTVTEWPPLPFKGHPDNEHIQGLPCVGEAKMVTVEATN